MDNVVFLRACFLHGAKISVQKTSSLYELQVILFLGLVVMLLHGAELFVTFEGRGHLRDSGSGDII